MTSTKFGQALAAMRAFPAAVVQRPQAIPDALLNYVGALAHISATASGFPAVQSRCEQLQRHLQGIRQAPRELSLHEVSLLTRWPDIVEEALTANEPGPLDRLQQSLLDAGVSPEMARRLGLAPETPLDTETDTEDESPVRAPADPDEAPVEPTPLDLAMDELSELLEEMGPAGNRTLSQDGVMRYAMAVMQVRDEAESARIDPLLTACDDVSTTLAALMESEDDTSSDALEALAAFAHAAPRIARGEQSPAMADDGAGAPARPAEPEPEPEPEPEQKSKSKSSLNWKLNPPWRACRHRMKPWRSPLKPRTTRHSKPNPPRQTCRPSPTTRRGPLRAASR